MTCRRSRCEKQVQAHRAVACWQRWLPSENAAMAKLAPFHWTPRVRCISACRGATSVLLNSGKGLLRPGNAVTRNSDSLDAQQPSL